MGRINPLLLPPAGEGFMGSKALGISSCLSSAIQHRSVMHSSMDLDQWYNCATTAITRIRKRPIISEKFISTQPILISALGRHWSIFCLFCLFQNIHLFFFSFLFFFLQYWVLNSVEYRTLLLSYIKDAINIHIHVFLLIGFYFSCKQNSNL